MRFLTIAVFSIALAFAQPPAPDFTALKTATGVTDAQITQLQTLQKDQMTEMQTYLTQLHTAEQTLQSALAAASPVPATVGQAAIAVQNIRKQMQSIHDTYNQRALALVTADVKAKLDTLSTAAKLAPAIQEAGMLNLIVLPAQGPDRMGGPGGPGGPGAMRRGPMPSRMGPPPSGAAPMGFRPPM